MKRYVYLSEEEEDAQKGTVVVVETDFDFRDFVER